MQQSRLGSLAEACVNTASGFIVSYIIWFTVAGPIYDIPVNHVQTLGITIIFTITSVARSYLWRRFFARGIHRWMHRILSS